MLVLVVPQATGNGVGVGDAGKSMVLLSLILLGRLLSMNIPRTTCEETLYSIYHFC